jgi:hypothetical protein
VYAGQSPGQDAVGVGGGVTMTDEQDGGHGGSVRVAPRDGGCDVVK